jgi:DNA-binding LacI/PurR family transcriptional regulator
LTSFPTSAKLAYKRLQKEITIKDIAREAGVDISTVSRSLSGAYGIKADTRNRVLAVAQRLNYRVNRVARGLVTGRSHTLGLIISDIRNPFFAEVARGAEDAARAAGCDLVLCNSDQDATRQMEYIAALAGKRVDGILMNSVAVLDKDQKERLEAIGIPIVLLNRTRGPFSTVCADNKAGGTLAAEYLLKLGHRRVAHLTGPARHGNLTDREKAFVKAMPPDSVTVLHGENSFAGGREMAQTILAGQPRRITAIFAGNDTIAFGVLRAILDANLKVPDDISLLGFDNVELGGIVQPPLTTIHQPSYELGQRAVETLLRLGKKDAPAENHVLPVQLIERQSCAPATQKI